MTWSDQAESMAAMWTEAQKTMWQSWYSAVQSAAPSPALLWNRNLLDDWQRMANQGLEMWSRGTNSSFRTTSEQMLASQTAMLQMLQATTQAWQSMAPRLDAGQDWNEVLKAYTEQMRQRLMPNPAAMGENLKDTAQLWQLYTTQLRDLLMPWMTIAQRAPTMMMGMPGGNGDQRMLEFTQMGWDAFGQTFGSLVRSPSFGLTREFEEKLSNAFDGFLKLQQASTDYQLLMADAWAGVFSEVMNDIRNRAEQGNPVESVRDLSRVWLGAADRSFDKLFRTEEYAQVQGKFVSALMDYRIKERTLVEEILKSTYLASQGDIDESNRNVYLLRKEVKALRKELKALRANSDAPAKRTTRRTSSRSKAKDAEVGEAVAEAPAGEGEHHGGE